MTSLNPLVRASATALLLIVCAGCHKGISWLPDSSGFVFVGGKKDDQLMLFDVGTKKTKRLAEVDGPAWPAVSPDGKRIAVATREIEGKKYRIRVSVFDREGRPLHRSKVLYEAAVDPDKGERAYEGSALPHVGWAPEGGRLLLGFGERTLLYDFEAGKSEAIPGALIRVGNEVVRPDGKGFLVRTKEGYSFVGWDRKAQPIKPSAACDERSAKSLLPLSDKGPPSPGLRAYLASAESSRWVGKAAVFPGGERIDTAKLEVADDEAPWHPPYHLARGVTVELFGFASARVSRHGRTQTLTFPDSTRCFPSPDGKWLAIGWKSLRDRESPQQLILLNDKGDLAASIPERPDRTTPEAIASLTNPTTMDDRRSEEVRLLAFSRDGKDLTVADDYRVWRWDLTRKEFDKPALSRVFKEVNSGHVALSADGRVFAALYRYYGLKDVTETIYVYDVTTGKILATRKDEADRGVTVLALSPDGKSLAVGTSKGVVRLHDLTNKKPPRTLEANKGGPAILAFSPDGKALRSAGAVRAEQAAKLRFSEESGRFHRTMETIGADRVEYRSWDVLNDGKPTLVRCRTKPPAPFALDPSGKAIATLIQGGEPAHEVRLWDLATSKQTVALRGATGPAVFSPDGRLLAACGSDETIRLWDARSGKAVATYWNFLGRVRQLAFSPDGKLLACATEETIEVWRVPAFEK